MSSSSPKRRLKAMRAGSSRCWSEMATTPGDGRRPRGRRTRPRPGVPRGRARRCGPLHACPGVSPSWPLSSRQPPRRRIIGRPLGCCEARCSRALGPFDILHLTCVLQKYMFCGTFMETQNGTQKRRAATARRRTPTTAKAELPAAGTAAASTAAHPIASNTASSSRGTRACSLAGRPWSCADGCRRPW